MTTAKKTPISSAERSRIYRDRKRKERETADRLAAVERDGRDAPAGVTTVTASPPPAPAKIVLRDSVQASIDHMKWLKPTDFALRDHALMVAGQIDDLIEADPTATGRATSLGQLLARLLRELGGAPTVRLQHELRSLRLLAGVADEGGDGGHDEQENQSQSHPQADLAPVLPIRPAKRKRA